jgi:hypothetical protein
MRTRIATTLFCALALAAVLGNGNDDDFYDNPHVDGGGEVPKDQPVLVGERGQEVVIPQKPAIVLPTWKGGYAPKQDAGDFVAPQVGPWDRWLAGLSESQNVQDLRTPQQKIEDNELWRVTWDPTFDNPYESWWYDKNRVQFPPAEEKPKPTKTSDTGKATPNLPDWLKDQESQWLKSDKAKKLRER